MICTGFRPFGFNPDSYSTGELEREFSVHARYYFDIVVCFGKFYHHIFFGVLWFLQTFRLLSCKKIQIYLFDLGSLACVKATVCLLV